MLEGYIGNEYLRALAIFILVFVVVRGIAFVLARIVPVFTSRTKTNLDDVILKRTSAPLTFVAAMLGIWIAYRELSFGGAIDTVIEGAIMTLIIIAGAILAYVIVDSFITIGFAEFGRSKRVKVRVNKSLLYFFHSLLIIVVYVAAFLIILSSWGIEIGPLLAGVGVAGIAIAFALQSTLANIFGGVSILLDKSVSLGDVVRLDDGTLGTIQKINLRSTRVNTFDNEVMIVPNAKLADSYIQNIALPEPKSRVVVPFGVAYGSNIETVKKIVMKEIRSVDHFIEEPEPSVRFLEMADSSLNFKAFFYVDSYTNRFAALDEANTKIYNALNRAGIEIPFPQMDVHVKKK